MRCAEVQEYLAERLAGSLSDRLSGTLHNHVRTHMLSCPECCEEMEDFEEMQAALRAIPIEPCDSEAMRARFDLLMGAKEAKIKQLPIPAKILLAVTVVASILVIAVLELRDERMGKPASNVVSEAPSPTPKPAEAPVQSVAPAAQPVPVPASGMALPEEKSEVSDTQLVTVDVTVRDETGDRLPYKPDISIVFNGTDGEFRVAASCVVGNLFRAAVPANRTFTVSVNNVASGYNVESVVDSNMTDLMHDGLFTAIPRVSSPSRIVITLKKN